MSDEADVIVVGSGPGGSIVAKYLVEAGLSVFVLEAGANITHQIGQEYTTSEMTAKYKNGGLTTTTGSTNINYVEASCVGGGSEINSGLYHRTPKYVIDEWRQMHGFSSDYLEMEKIFQKIEKYLSISKIPKDFIPEASKRLQLGASIIGANCVEVPRWYKMVENKMEKNTISKSYLKDAISAGAELISETRAVSVRKVKSKWIVKCKKVDGSKVLFKSKFLFICCGVISSSALLSSSGISQNSGAMIRMHPTAKIVAQFEDELASTSVSVPVHQVKEWTPNITVGCSVSKKPHLGLALISNDSAFEKLDTTYKKMAVYYASISGGSGKLKRYPFNQFILNYKLTETDFKYLRFGLLRLTEMLFLAGSQSNFLVSSKTFQHKSYDELEQFLTPRNLQRLDLMTIHLMGGNSFAKNSIGVCDQFGRVKGHENLFVQDASLIPTSLGVNPQGTIMALVTRNMEMLLDEFIR